MELQIDRREVTPALIEEIARRIAEHFDPRRIVLFGSWARGDAGPHSDIDLFVEMESGKTIPERAVSISRIFGLRWWSMDIVVYTPEEVEQVSGVVPRAVGSGVLPRATSGRKNAESVSRLSRCHA